jgi:hypothetical protein
MWKWLLNLEIIYIQYQSKVVCRKRLNSSNEPVTIPNCMLLLCIPSFEIGSEPVIS